jgi:hypothetical protein
MQVDTIIKGFKLDDEKRRSRVTKPDDDTRPDWEINWYGPIISCIPRTAYIEIGAGHEANGEIVTVIVLEIGKDREEMENEPVHTDDKVLTEIAKDVLTPGVWLSL